MTTGRPNSDELLSAFHDGELAGDERAAAERLLEESSDARIELEDYRALSELLGSLPNEKPPVDLRAAVLQQIQRQPATPSGAAASAPPAAAARSPRWKRRFVYLAGGLTAAAALVLGINLFDGRFGDPPRLAHQPSEVAATDAETTFAADDAAAPQASEVAPGKNVARASFRGDSPEFAAKSLDRPMSAPPRADLKLMNEYYFAGEEARPPEDAGPGDVYQYLEQTDHGVVVVEATVVDVRQAIDRVQFLLSRNSIPTRPVRLGRAAAADDGTEPPTTGELAVYVESDPKQLNLALQALDEALANGPGVFLDVQVAGVLEAPSGQAAPARFEERLGELDVSPPDRSDVRLRMGATPSRGLRRANQEPLATGGAPQESPPSGQSRMSVTSGRAAREPAPPATEAVPALKDSAEQKTDAFAEPAADRDDSSRRSGAVPPPPAAKPAGAPLANYNQLVTYPDELKQQVRFTDVAKLQAGEPLAEQLLTIQNVQQQVRNRANAVQERRNAVPTDEAASGGRKSLGVREPAPAGSALLQKKSEATVPAPATTLAEPEPDSPAREHAESSDSDSDKSPMNRERFQAWSAPQSGPAGPMRLRLLFVLQTGAQKTKAQASPAQATPVEAPRPPRTKG